MNSAVALIPDDTVEQRVLGIVHVHCLSTARLAQSVERKALNFVVVGSNAAVSVLCFWSLPQDVTCILKILQGASYGICNSSSSACVQGVSTLNRDWHPGTARPGPTQSDRRRDK